KKTVSVWNGSWVQEAEKLFVYDGWNMICEITSENSRPATEKYYVWGIDLSQSLQGAGGIGGLIATLDNSASVVYYYFYDANGNVGQLANAADGSIAAHYEYDPFGNIIKSEGEYKDSNPYRFSTKFFDSETGLIYFGFRHYSSEMGRWVNRDPIGENGGINYYTYIMNNPIDIIDYLGLSGCFRRIDSEDQGDFCCCCVEDLAIPEEEISEIRLPGVRMGHSFKLNIEVSYKKGGKKGRCSLEWWEKTDLPAFKKHSKDTWTDMFQLVTYGYKKTAIFSSWHSRKEGEWNSKCDYCPNDEIISIPDDPSIAIRNRTKSRLLEFFIVVKSASNCQCEKNSLTVRAEQFLKSVKGTAMWDKSYFKIIPISEYPGDFPAH
ncbi:MAG: RHS repeat-associated core domain-containing protein, partial [Desulfobacterales bacterium]|nr:RHS repeat-associated core domain-containing protein [Desulfobacterales bacterium]